MMEFHLQIHEYLKTLCIAPAEMEHLLQKEQLSRLVLETSALQNEEQMMLMSTIPSYSNVSNE